MSDTNDERGRSDEPTDPTAPPQDSPADWPPPADVTPPAPGPATEPLPAAPSPYAGPAASELPPPPAPYDTAQGYGAPPPYGSPPAYGPPPPPPYGAPPAYGEVAVYGQPQPYGQPPGPSDGYAPWPYAPPGTYGVPRRNGSALALTITSGILSVFCCSVLTLPALILGIVALAKQSTDPAGSTRYARYGWIAFGVGLLVTLVVAAIFFALSLGGAFDDSSYYEGY